MGHSKTNDDGDSDPLDKHPSTLGARLSNLLFGASSILGFRLAKSNPLSLKAYVPKAKRASSLAAWPVLHLADSDWIKHQFESHAPKLLIYCHAVCDVSKCEANPDWAYDMNVQQLHRVIDALPDATRLVYISSDHVFGGDGDYTESAAPCPISIYGRTRVAAEQAVLKRKNSLVIRPGLAIGSSTDGRSGHMDWLAYRSQRGLPITIIEDEYRSVVWAGDLAARVMQLSESAVCGLRHIPAAQVISRLRLARYLFQSMGEPAHFKVEHRDEQPAPHLGRVGLETGYTDAYSKPLRSVVSGPLPLKKGD